MGALYQLTSPSGKSYIGISSKTTDARWAKHVEHAIGKRDAGALYAALRKYGPAAFAVKTLVIADDWEYLCELERKVIAALETKYPNGYNVTDGGEGVAGRVVTDEQRATMSAAQKKRFERQDQLNALMQAGAVGIQSRSASCADRRVDGLAPWQQRKRANSVRSGSTEHREKISASTKKAMARPEVKGKVIAAAQQRASDPTWRAKMSVAKKGVGLGAKRSAETKAKQADARRKWWAAKKAAQ